MPTLTGRQGSWELPHFHQWQHRSADYRAPIVPLISSDTRVVTIGSCFAEELARGMARLKIGGAMHPTGLFYNTGSIRQEIERIFGGWPEYAAEPMWRIRDGWVHPFKNADRVFETEAELRRWSDDLDRAAEALFRSAEVIVITLGLIEAWRNPVTRNVYRVLPHPDVFQDLRPVFTRLTVNEMQADLECIRTTIRRHTRAELIVTVSPVPLHATMTDRDVRIANVESKSRIRAAVSEFVETHPDVRYFHSYELVTTSERLSDFMEADGRHVQRRAVDYILSQFVRTFGSGLAIPDVDESWITQPEKTAARPRPKPIERVVTMIPRPLREAVLSRLPRDTRESLRALVRNIKARQ